MHNSSTARRKGPDTDPWLQGTLQGVMDSAFRSCNLGSVGRANPTDPWSITLEVNPGSGMMDQGSVNAPLPLEHRDPGVGWSVAQLVLDVMRNRIALG